MYYQLLQRLALIWWDHSSSPMKGVPFKGQMELGELGKFF
jgi:hypothetical protein